jgi:hypothetical protein
MTAGSQRAPQRRKAAPQLANIARRNGVCGEYSHTVEVTNPGQATKVVQFNTGLFGNTYTVHMVDGDTRCDVSESWRYGSPLRPERIRSFYAAGGTPR